MGYEEPKFTQKSLSLSDSKHLQGRSEWTRQWNSASRRGAGVQGVERSTIKGGLEEVFKGWLN